jgi:hypothetical protein
MGLAVRILTDSSRCGCNCQLSVPVLNISSRSYSSIGPRMEPLKRTALFALHRRPAAHHHGGDFVSASLSARALCSGALARRADGCVLRVNSMSIIGSCDNQRSRVFDGALQDAERRLSTIRRRRLMITRQLLPVFFLTIGGLVLAIGGLALLGCANQRQAPSNVMEASNLTMSKIDPVGDASDVAAVSGSSLAGDAASSSAQAHAAQFAMPNPRQHVLSSGFPARDY